MVDQNQTDKTIEAVADSAKAAAATLETAAKADAAPAKTRGRKTATTARRPRANGAKTNQTSRKAGKTAARAATSASAAAAAPQIERTAPMTNDYNQMFASFQLPGVDKFQTLFADAGARGQDLVARSRDAAEEMTDLAKANVEAIAEATRIAATGAKSIGQDVIASSRTGFAQASDAIRTLADAKSPTEFFQLQSELVRSSFDRIVSDSARLTEQVVKLAGEAIQPISNRASVNAERVNELMA